MKIFSLFHKALAQFPLLKSAAPGQFNPVMVQRPLIDAGNTGRYSLEAFQVAFNSGAGTGTLAPNAPNHAGLYLDVTAQKAAAYGGMGSIPVTPGTTGLVQGFRDTGTAL